MSEPKPKPITADELRDQILNHLRQLVKYWATVEGDYTTEDRIDGAVFSALSMLDGTTMKLPAFDLVARPALSDKEYLKSRGEDWIEDGTVISTALHEFWDSTHSTKKETAPINVLSRIKAIEDEQIATSRTLALINQDIDRLKRLKQAARPFSHND